MLQCDNATDVHAVYGDNGLICYNILLLKFVADSFVFVLLTLRVIVLFPRFFCPSGE